MAEPRAIVVMGVSGCGKTTLGERLADALGWPFLDGDDLHPEANRRKMAAGQPLDDTDRRPWLDRVRHEIDDHLAQGQGVVVACSALRAAYRRRLGTDRDEILLVHLTAPPEILPGLLAARLGARAGHFFPPDLLPSQLETLEDPGPVALRLDLRATPDQLSRAVLAAVGE